MNAERFVSVMGTDENGYTRLPVPSVHVQGRPIMSSDSVDAEFIADDDHDSAIQVPVFCESASEYKPTDVSPSLKDEKFARLRFSSS